MNRNTENENVGYLPLEKRLVLATENQNKVREMRELLVGTDFEILSLGDFPDITLPPEDGETFIENAAVKACYVSRMTGMLALADDSGLAVDFLDGAPGVYSARFAGEDKSAAANNDKLLSLLAGVPLEKRAAAFKCVIAVADSKDNFIFFEGECAGIIGEEPRGENGFGYDPIFYLPQLSCTMAELSSAEKNSISHRAVALKKCIEMLKRIK